MRSRIKLLNKIIDEIGYKKTQYETEPESKAYRDAIVDVLIILEEWKTIFSK